MRKPFVATNVEFEDWLVRANARQGQASLSDRILTEIPRVRIYARLMTNDVSSADRRVAETLKHSLSDIDRLRTCKDLRIHLFMILRARSAREANFRKGSWAALRLLSNDCNDLGADDPSKEAPARFCSLIPGLGSSSRFIFAGSTVLFAVEACSPHDGVGQRVGKAWLNRSCIKPPEDPGYLRASASAGGCHGAELYSDLRTVPKPKVINGASGSLSAISLSMNVRGRRALSGVNEKGQSYDISSMSLSPSSRSATLVSSTFCAEMPSGGATSIESVSFRPSDVANFDRTLV